MSAALLLSATALLSTAAPALAHTSLKSSDPQKNSSINTVPSQIQLTFSEPVQVEPGAVSVAGPGGEQWTVGQVTVDKAVVTAPVTPIGPAGQYTINWRVISGDGHPLTGKVPFTLTVPAAAPTTTTPTTTTSPPTETSATQPGQNGSAVATATPTPAAQENEDSGGIPAWVWIVGAIVIIGLGVFAGMRFGKGKTAKS
ncbi:copper resistance protein CopC [Kibdelosporangium philippinense]|uniref:Copper resistance protein CopC n=1 Tax=Kibdelosporangium philippinense TaxID=211113 RepID=A0ABS8Z0L3_9PSEU|nr:copper resistance CopC family protein [Kibdelosporangium philippinense]MCE7001506.1 copper resistance protein CopC [Kibdelosporangium philippinense]